MNFSNIMKKAAPDLVAVLIFLCLLYTSDAADE